MIKKLSQLMILCFLLSYMSCSEEEILNNEVEVAEQELAIDLSEYEDTSYGMYKGVFSTNDSGERGVVEIQVVNDVFAKATIELKSGTLLTYSGTPNRSANGELTVQFSGNATSFEFEVGEDGSHPTINRAVLNDKPSFISALKENTRGAVIANTGLYSGTNLSGVTVSGTWNITFDSQADADGNTMAFTTQIIVSGTDFGGAMGNVQENCADDGTFQTCDVSGAGDMNAAIVVTWSGVHTSLLAEECSQFEGNWTATGAGGGGSGTFISDQQCAPPENDECAGAVVIACGDVLSASTAAATTTGEPGTFCGTTNPNGAGIWYTYIGISDGDFVTVDLTGSTYDTKLFLYTGSCGMVTCIDGNDDGGAGTTSRLTFVEEAGVTYYLYAAGFDGASGTLNVAVSCDQAAPGNSFATAIPITPSPEGTGCAADTFTVDFGDTSNGIFTDAPTDATCGGLQDIFYTWTATEENLLFDTGLSNPGIAIYATDGTQIDCLGTFSSGELTGWAIGDDLIIQIYDGSNVDATVGFCLEEFATPPPPPECGGNLSTFNGATGAIPDNNCDVTNQFIVTSTVMGTIGVDADIDNITINITHTWDSDLDITLISPAGTELELTSDNGGSDDNYTNAVFRDGGDDVTSAGAPFTGIFQPEGGTFATTFDGESVSGDWILQVCDDAGGDTGTVDSWTLNICDSLIPDSFNDSSTGVVKRPESDKNDVIIEMNEELGDESKSK